MSQTMQNIFRNLEGKWSIKRTLQFDRNSTWHAVGSVDFTKSAVDVLHYQEVVKVTIPYGNTYDAHQEYDFKYDAVQDVISKYRSSEELMYILDLIGGIYRGIYKCGLDKYVATYKFIDASHFTMQYIISGPDKNCMIITKFEKVEMDLSGDMFFD
jgi:hypothetical protein